MTDNVCTCVGGGEAVAHCSDCNDYLCRPCKEAHERTKLTKGHSLRFLLQANDRNVTKDSNGSNVELCSVEKHANVELSVYCRDCHEVLCEHCACDGHKEHTRVTLDVAYEGYYDQLLNLIKCAESKNLATMETFLAEDCKRISDNTQRYKENLQKQFDTYINILVEKRGRLMAHVEDICDKHMSEVQKKKEGLPKLMATLAESKARAEALLKENRSKFMRSCEEIINDLKRMNRDVKEVQKATCGFDIPYTASATDDFGKIVEALGIVVEHSISYSEEGRFPSAEDVSIPRVQDIQEHLIVFLKSLTVSNNSLHLISEDRGVSKAETLSMDDVHQTSEVNEEISYTCPLWHGKSELINSRCFRLILKDRFKTWKVNAECEISEDIMKIRGQSDDDVQQCLNLINDTVIEKRILLQKDELVIIDSDKWLRLVEDLKKKHHDQLWIDILDIQDRKHVVLYAACTAVVNDASDAIRIFFRENMIKSVKLSFDKDTINRIMKDKHFIKKICASYSQFCVSVTSTETEVTVTGIGSGLVQAVKMIHKKPSEQPVSTNSDDDVDRFNEDDDENSRFEDTAMSFQKSLVQMKLENGELNVKLNAIGFFGDDRVLFVVTGDLTELPVEALVNAADQSLCHNGGLAKVIVKKGGRSIQEECTDHFQRNGQLKEGEVFCSKPGMLPCAVILHAVGPKWIDGKHNEVSLLERAVWSCLRSASSRLLTSIAIPAISAGTYKFPANLACKIIVNTVKKFLVEYPRCRLKEFYLCDLSPNTVAYFTMAVKESLEASDVIIGEMEKQLISSCEDTKQQPQRNIQQELGEEQRQRLNDLMMK